jgi:hypothetical protein
MMAMMVSLEHHLRERSDEDVERRFFPHTLQYLTTSSGHQIAMKDWMVTSYEVEFGQEIGSGGLYVFSTISYSSVEYMLIVGFLQWESVQRELEQDNGGTQSTRGGRWHHAYLKGTSGMIALLMPSIFTGSPVYSQ